MSRRVRKTAAKELKQRPRHLTYNDELRLRNLLDHERDLTSKWYARMTDSLNFSAEERHDYGLRFEKIENEIHHLQQKATTG